MKREDGELNGCWRSDAIAIVEGLMVERNRACWDELLDLRGALVAGTDWRRMLDHFLACRERLELDNYLPFYRLRRLLATSLRLEASMEGGVRRSAELAAMLRTQRSFDEVERALRRDWFEHDLGFETDTPLELIVREAPLSAHRLALR